jgi:hypothetical protein
MLSVRTHAPTRAGGAGGEGKRAGGVSRRGLGSQAYARHFPRTLAFAQVRDEPAERVNLVGGFAAGDAVAGSAPVSARSLSAAGEAAKDVGEPIVVGAA